MSYNYPTSEHQKAAQALASFLSNQEYVDAVLLTCSCARGKATADSCLDIAILLSESINEQQQAELAELWQSFYKTDTIFQALHKVGKYSEVHLDFTRGQYVAQEHNWTTGPDPFELEIGNYLVYSVPLWQRNEHLNELKQKWLPYYEDELRYQRLTMVCKYCLNNLDHIPLYVERALYFQCLQRLHHAFGEFLQALFIQKRTYPIAYDKWIKEQIVEILGMPELYKQLVSIFEISRLESKELAQKAEKLKVLLNRNLEFH